MEDAPIPYGTSEGDSATSTEATATATSTARSVSLIGSQVLGRAAGGRSLGLGGLAFRGAFVQTAVTSTNGDADASQDDPDEVVCDSSSEDLIVLARKTKRDSDEVGERGRQPKSEIDKRLIKIAEKLESQGKASSLERVQQKTAARDEKAEAQTQKKQDREEKAVERKAAAGPDKGKPADKGATDDKGR